MFLASVQLFSPALADITAASEGENGYRIEEIAVASDKTEDGSDSGWYYGRPDVEGKLVEKVGPFKTSAEAMKHLEEELFADDED